MHLPRAVRGRPGWIASSLATRYAVATAVVALLGACAGVVGLRAMDSLRSDVELVRERELEGLVTLDTARRDALEIRQLAVDHATSTSPAGLDTIEAQIAELDGRIEGRLASLQNAWSSSQKLRMLGGVREALAMYRRARDETTLRASRNGNREIAIAAATGPVRRVFGELVVAFDRLVVVNQEEAARRVGDARATYESARVVLGASMAGALLIGLVVALGGARSLRRRLDPLAGAAASLAAGDLSARAAVGGQDEVSSLARSFNDMASALEHREDELRTSRELYRRLVENSRELICLYDVHGRITYASPAYREAIALDADAIVGISLLEHVHPDDAPLLEAAFASALGGEPAGVEVRLRDGDGWLDVEGTLTPVVTESGIEGVLGVARDVSERRALEEQLRQTQKMEAIGRLAGGIAHDFNNLLTAMAGFNHMLLRELPARDPRRDHAEQLAGAIDRAGELTHQLLAFSRRQVLRPQVIDLNAVVADMGTLLRRVLGEDVDLHLSLATTLPAVRVDPVQLEQVLLNLAVNGREAMPHGGALTVETSDVVLSPEYSATHLDVRPGHYVVLAVTDSGVGMDDETKARVFEPFFTTKDSGTGLGLATVYGIVKQLGGEIWVYSEPGRGTTFKIYFPATEVPGEARPASAEGVTVGGTETVLVVEDDELVAGLVVRSLQQHGYDVLRAADADDALAVAAGHAGAIHLLLTDVVLPGSNGRRLARRLRAAREGVRVLFMSGYTEKAIVHRGTLGDDAEFIHKPFSPDALARRVRQVLDAPA